MPESPKEFFRRHVHGYDRSVLPRPVESSPKSVFRFLADRRRRLERERHEQEVLALCARAELERDAEPRLAALQGIRGYDLGGMAPGIRQIVWRVMDRIAAAHHGQDAHDAGPQRPVPPGG